MHSLCVNLQSTFGMSKLNVFAFVIVFVFFFFFVFVIVFLSDRSCLLITLIKCLKGQSAGSLFEGSL